jgi:hypothetical protein
VGTEPPRHLWNPLSHNSGMRRKHESRA